MKEPLRKPRPRSLPPAKLGAALAWVLALAVGSAHGQTGSESSVGYIDNAIPANLFRLRVDAAYNNPFADRGEFFYMRSVEGPGDKAETRVDYQELSASLEVALHRRFSVFAEVPVRLINPTVDVNAAGIGDVSAGFKWAFLHCEDVVASFQFRTYAPSGNGLLHLGTGHVSLEPALLGFARLAEGLTTEGELRLWVPVGGVPGYDSHVLRYGVGLSYQAWEAPRLSIAPVVEVVGWTFLDGQKTVPLPDGSPVILGAGGDTIVNLKLGVRFRLPQGGDVYLGYGRPLTGDTMYRDIVRLEYRLAF
jgi:hypothetical protein